jgi:hypothetical protein
MLRDLSLEVQEARNRDVLVEHGSIPYRQAQRKLDFGGAFSTGKWGYNALAAE